MGRPQRHLLPYRPPMPRRSRRSVYDIVTDISGRDEEAQVEVAEILSVLPEDHPARAGFAANRSTIDLTHQVGGRQDLIDALMASYWARHKRLQDRTAGLKHKRAPS